MTKRLVSALLAVMLFAVLTGCNTIHGMGKDIEQGGKAIERAAH